MTKRDESYDSVWDAITDTPAESESMKLRSHLMIMLKQHISDAKLTQEQAAKAFGVTQPCISDLNRGKINLFGLNALVTMAAAAGIDPQDANHPPVDSCNKTKMHP